LPSARTYTFSKKKQFKGSGVLAEQRAQRRLAAILAADIVGYSRLMEADEAGTLARVKTLRAEFLHPKVAEYGGRVVKTTGDGTLIEFPSAVDAVQHAIDVQREMARRNADVPEATRIALRMGINIGDVILDGDDIYGDGVNVAARLEALAEPGGICISGAVRDHVGNRVEATFDDMGEQTVKNMSRPVRVYRARPSVDERYLPTQGGSLPLPDRPSIAVLPFQNMSGDPEQEYFADGITEDIITELSRFRSLFVIARNSTFTFKGRSVDHAEVARTLGVRYLVEGSVRKAGARVRVTVQLIDAKTGHHLWAERYDRDLEDIFAVQDELTRAIVSILPGRLEDADRERAERKRTTDVTAYDHVLLGNEHWKRMWIERGDEARVHFQKAIEIDPHYARAYAAIAWTHNNDMFLGVGTEHSLEAALENIEIALSLDDNDSWFHAVHGQILFQLGRDQEAEAAFRRALALNPNDADAKALMANTLVYLGRWKDALLLINDAMRLNPFPPQLYHWYRAIALYSARAYGDAVGAVHEIRSVGGWIWRHALIAICHAQLGQTGEASAALEAFLDGRRAMLEARGKQVPESTIGSLRARADRYRDDRDRDHFLDGFRKAGLPE
jgi:adenylate cyclase